MLEKKGAGCRKNLKNNKEKENIFYLCKESGKIRD
jgi:hypothetical protein